MEYPATIATTGFWTGADLALEIQHVQVVRARIILVSAVVTADFLIAAGAEGFLPSPVRMMTPTVSS